MTRNDGDPSHPPRPLGSPDRGLPPPGPPPFGAPGPGPGPATPPRTAAPPIPPPPLTDSCSPLASRAGIVAAAIAAGVLLLIGLVGGGAYLVLNSDLRRDVADGSARRPLEEEREPRKDHKKPARPRVRPPEKGDQDVGRPAQEPLGQGDAPEAGEAKNPRPAPPHPPAQENPQKENPPTADEAFAALQEKIKAFKADKDRTPVWPPDPKTGLELFPLDQKFADVLDTTLVLGKRADFSVTPQRAPTPAWKWDFKVGNECLATLELAGGKVVMRRGNAPDEVWAKHEKLLRGMPIVFTRPGRPLSADSVISVAGRAELQLPAGPTLHDLLCGDGKTVDLVGPGSTAIEEVVIKSGVIPVKDSPVQLRIIPVAADQARLELTAQIGDREYTLNEPIVFTTQTVGRELGAWATRETRFAKSMLSGIKPFKERDMSVDIPNREKNLSAIFRSLLEDGFPGRKFSQPTIIKYVEAWTGEDKAMGAYINEFKTFEKVREILCTYVAERTEGDDTFAEVQARRFAQEHPEPLNPGDKYTPPQRKPEEKDKEYEARHAAQKKEYDRQKAAWTTWSECRNRAISDAVRDPVHLRQFFDAHRAQMKPDDEVGPELAAIQVLLGLDGLILAKCHRAEIETLLKRVPVAALVEGESRIRWTIDFLDDVSIPAHLLPADVLDTPAAATPPDDPLPALPSP